jgi:hypothetical protein
VHVNIAISKRVSLLILFAWACFGLASCGSNAAEVQSAFPADWTVLCTDEEGDVEEVATIGEPTGSERFLDAADLQRTVVHVRDVDAEGVAQSLEIGIRIKTTENLPEEIEYKSGGSSQGQFVKQKAAVQFTPSGDYQKSVFIEIELDSGGSQGFISLFAGGQIQSINTSYAAGVYSAIVPLQGLSIAATDMIQIHTLASWEMPQGFNFLASDTTSSCQAVESDTTP